MIRVVTFLLAAILVSPVSRAQDDDYNTRARKYVEQYCKMAMAEQRLSGIPASITLGQGILETEAGTSELMLKANNHFGIKCKNGWMGETFLHTDDAPNECFKKYSCAAESYHDHSMHLKRNPRYAPLFKLPETDYEGWAVCLKRCGYATNPQYAQRLIKIIENFKLQEYTYTALEHADSNFMPVSESISGTQDIQDAAGKKPARDATMQAAPAAATAPAVSEASAPAFDAAPDDTGNVILVNGLRAFMVHKGERLETYAADYHIPYRQLLAMNDLDDAPVPFDMNIYLEPKLTTGTHPVHILTSDESLLMVAQQESMQLKSLRALNLLNPADEPVNGTILELQKTAAQKPGIKIKAIPAHPHNAIVSGSDTAAAQGDFITIDRNPATKPAAKPAIAAIPAPANSKPAATITAVKPAEALPASPEIPAAAPAAAIATPAAAPAPAVAVPQKVSDTLKPKARPVIYYTKPVKKPLSEMTDEEIEAESAKKAELSKLKAELDKIVYADDSKLAVPKEAAPAAVPDKKQEAAPKRGVQGSATPKEGKFYTVKKGDTAFSIAKRYNITVSQLLQWNHIESSDIKAGQTLQVKE